MKFWLHLLNSLALGFVLERVTAWAKKRWGLSDPPRWVWGVFLAGTLLFGVYSEGMPFLESLGYYLLSISILGTLVGAFLLPPSRRHE